MEGRVCAGGGGFAEPRKSCHFARANPKQANTTTTLPKNNCKL
jgi:hypothetical protein